MSEKTLLDKVTKQGYALDAAIKQRRKDAQTVQSAHRLVVKAQGLMEAGQRALEQAEGELRELAERLNMTDL